MLTLYASGRLDARTLLALALEAHYEIAPLPEIVRTARGKPYFARRPELHFSLSHSGTLALCAVGDVPVGADIERVRPRRSGLARYALDEREYRRFLALGARWEDFYACWTRREAWCKWTGEGVAATLRKPLPPGAPLVSYEGDGWRAAVCAGGTLQREILWISAPEQFTKA